MNVFAWKCEECNRWRPGSEAPFVVIVNEGSGIDHTINQGPVGNVHRITEQGQRLRRMMICRACHDQIEAGHG